MICDHAKQKVIWHGGVTITVNECVAENTFRLRLTAPELIAHVLPGQFLMLRLANTDDPLLGRPLAVYRVDTTAGAIELVYLVVGKMTRRLSQLPLGTPLQAWGPLGNGFDPPETDHLIMLAGGIGHTPFYLLAEEALGLRSFAMRCDANKNHRVKKASLLFGAKSQNRLSCLDEFRELGVNVKVATEDGSQGVQGLVTDLIAPTIAEAALPRVALACCGPQPMLQAVFRAAQALGDLPCDVSLESPMACGLGICFSCVVKYRDENGTPDFVRTCVDGPVFDAYRLVWDK
jgi:2-polyprenylphenol hydroxylase and related flavodoxin oxidoreductases